MRLASFQIDLIRIASHVICIYSSIAHRVIYRKQTETPQVDTDYFQAVKCVSPWHITHPPLAIRFCTRAALMPACDRRLRPLTPWGSCARLCVCVCLFVSMSAPLSLRACARARSFVHSHRSVSQCWEDCPRWRIANQLSCLPFGSVLFY